MVNLSFKTLQTRSRSLIIVAAGLVALAAGIWVSPVKDWLHEALESHTSSSMTAADLEALVKTPGNETLLPLWTAVQNSQGLERDRAQYRFASALLDRKQGSAALPVLRNLDHSYTVLSPHIQVKRALAYQQMGDIPTAQEAWQAIAKNDADNPASVEALYQLGKQDPTVWDTAIAKFPAHPRTLDIANQRLAAKNSPTALADRLLIARHGLYRDDYGTVLAELVGQHSQQLQPQDWDAIAFGYWEHQDYLRAAKAYARGSFIPRNLYRVGRGLQLGQQDDADQQKAIQAYQTLLARFPKADESGLALRRLAQLVEPNQRLAYLDRVIAQFPKEAPAALLQKIEWAKSTKNGASAKAAAQQLLKQYSKSESAADYRWQVAQAEAKRGDRKSAMIWAQQVVTHNPDSEFAPAALFWLGKWTATSTTKPNAGRPIYSKVLQHYPSSYYAWRAASQLGWPVGDFQTVRQLHRCTDNRCGVSDIPRPALAVGSEALRELYTIGAIQDAWALWQVEFRHPVEPTVTEQYTDGLLRQARGDYLDGIFMVSFLSQRDKPNEKAQVRTLKQQKDYSYALYPLPYWDLIAQWSTSHRVNPWLVVGLMRQESRFQPKIRSSVGAIGLMQVMPDTGTWIADKLNQKTFDLENPAKNVEFGTWYLAHTHDEYQNNALLAVASYNAGPGAVGGWVKRFQIKDGDEFAENIPYDETRKYVKAVFENYWNYLRLYDPEIRRKLP